MRRIRIYKGLLCDLDDTLLDRRSSFMRFARLFYKRYKVIAETETFDRFYSRLLALDSWAEEPKGQLFDKILSIWPEIPNTANELEEQFWRELIKGMKPIVGVQQFIDLLVHHGVPWGVVTNGDDKQFEKIKQAGLEGIFPFVMVSDLFGARKPDPSIYGAALDMLGTSASETLFIGDNPYTDIVGAQRSGMGSAWLTHGRAWPSELNKPDHVITHVAETCDLLF